MSDELMRLRVENQNLRAKVEVLEEVQEMMNYLEAAGIDNCEAYDIGMAKFHNRNVEEPKAKKRIKKADQETK